jgi:hypothetical protein
MLLALSLGSSMFMLRRPSVAAVVTTPVLNSLMIWRIAYLSCCKAATVAVKAAGLNSASLSGVESMILQIPDRKVSRDSITASCCPSRALVMYSCRVVVIYHLIWHVGFTSPDCPWLVSPDHFCRTFMWLPLTRSSFFASRLRRRPWYMQGRFPLYLR